MTIHVDEATLSNLRKEMWQKGYSRGYLIANETRTKIKQAKHKTRDSRFKDLLDYIQTRKDQ